MKIKTKMVTSFLIIAVIAFLSLALAYMSLINLREAGFKVALNEAPLVDASMEIKLELLEGHLWLEELMSGDTTQKWEKIKEKFEQGRWFANAIINGGQNEEGKFIATENSQIRSNIKEILKLIDKFIIDAKKRVDFAKKMKQRQTAGQGEGEAGAANASLQAESRRLDQEFDADWEQIQKKVDVVETLLKKEMNRGVQQMISTANAGQTIMIIASIVAIVLALSIGLFTAVRLSKPITLLTNASLEIKQGNLELENVNVKTKDELGTLAESFNDVITSLKTKVDLVEEIAHGDLTVKVELASEKDRLGKTLREMVNSLNELISQTQASVEQVASGSEQISDASQSLSQGASEQASSVEEISSIASEINSQAKLNADNTKQSSEIAKEAMRVSSQATERMKDLIEAMEQINRSSEETKKIVKVIDDIAFQINLLALNANVEAARAGKYGKGFAVVAEEVRNLAIKSADSVKETTKMVENAMQNINNGNEIVKDMATVLEDIYNGASKASDLMDEVSVASSEQAHALEQINAGLQQIESVTESNTANAEESAATSEELSSQAQQLKALIERFKVTNIKALPGPNELYDKLPDNIITAIKSELNKGNFNKKNQQNSGQKNNQNKNTGKVNINEYTVKDKQNNKTNKKIKPEEVISLDDDNFEDF